MSERTELLRNQILELVAEYHREAFAERPFVPGQTQVPVSGRVFDAGDMQSLVDSALDFWLTAGRFAEQFESEFARVLRRPQRPAGQFRLFGQPRGAVLPDLAEAGRAPPQAGRRSHNRGRRLPDYSQSYHPERSGAGICRYRHSHLQRDGRLPGSCLIGADARCHVGPHAGQSVRHQGC